MPFWKGWSMTDYSQGIIYAASICYPQTDLYVPLRLTVSADGKISMAKEELLEDVYEEENGSN